MGPCGSDAFALVVIVLSLGNELRVDRKPGCRHAAHAGSAALENFTCLLVVFSCRPVH